MRGERNTKQTRTVLERGAAVQTERWCFRFVRKKVHLDPHLQNTQMGHPIGVPVYVTWKSLESEAGNTSMALKQPRHTLQDTK